MFVQNYFFISCYITFKDIGATAMDSSHDHQLHPPAEDSGVDTSAEDSLLQTNFGGGMRYRLF